MPLQVKVVLLATAATAALISIVKNKKAAQKKVKVVPSTPTPASTSTDIRTQVI
jgi:hypothetical protein